MPPRGLSSEALSNPFVMAAKPRYLSTLAHKQISVDLLSTCTVKGAWGSLEELVGGDTDIFEHMKKVLANRGRNGWVTFHGGLERWLAAGGRCVWRAQYQGWSSKHVSHPLRHQRQG